MDAKRGLFRSTVHVTVLMIGNIVLSFISQLIVAYYFGTSATRDAYFSAVVIPTYITTVFSGSFAVVFLPQLVGLIENKSGEVIRFTSTVILLSSVLMSAIVLVGMIFADDIISITSFGFNESQKMLSSHLLTILFPTVLFQTLASLFSTVNQAYHKFIAAALVPITTPIVIAAVVFLFASNADIDALAYGSLIGSIIPAMILFAGLVRSKRIGMSIGVRDPAIRLTILASLPLFISGILFRLTSVVERMIASNLSEGSISFLGYANQLSTTLTMLITGGISTTIFPLMAQAWAMHDVEQFYRYITQGIVVVFLLCTPIMVMIFLFGEPIIKVLLERGAFGPSSTQAVSVTFKILMGSFLFSSLGGVMSKAFYVMSKTKTIAFIAVAEIGIYLLMGFWLSREYSYKGLAVALSVSTGVNILFCTLILFLNDGMKKLSRIGLNILKIAAAAVMEIAVASLVFMMVDGNLPLLLSMTIAGAAGLMTYMYFSIFFFSIDAAHFVREKLIISYQKLSV